MCSLVALSPFAVPQKPTFRNWELGGRKPGLYTKVSTLRNGANGYFGAHLKYRKGLYRKVRPFKGSFLEN